MTLLDLRQRAQTYTRSGRPCSRIRTFCRFGSKRRLVATIEWLRECPNEGPLPQLWQTFAIGEQRMVAGGLAWGRGALQHLARAGAEVVRALRGAQQVALDRAPDEHVFLARLDLVVVRQGAD